MSHIFVVDDNQPMRESIAKLLKRSGHEVSTANNGKDAWMMLYAGLPDLIVLDLMMPEMGGITFLRMLRRHHHWNEIPVIVITGLDHDESMVHEARDFGVVDVIRKGSDIADLMLREVDSALSGAAKV